MPMLDMPDIPAAAPVTLDPKTTAVLCLDISDASTAQVPAALACAAPVRVLLDKARAAGARVIFALGRAAEQKVFTDLAPRPDEHVVRSSADKFFNTDLADKLQGITTAVIVGTAANGAVLYTAFGACARGITVVVAEDGISSRQPVATWVARWQLLNQPGMANTGNAPLAAKQVTLSRTDLITFAK